MGGDRLADDQAIGNELADGGAGVGVGDLVDLVRVEPDLALTAAGDGARQALLGAEVDPEKEIVLVRCVPPTEPLCVVVFLTGGV